MSRWLLIDTPTWEEGKALIRAFFEAFPELDNSNIPYLEYESGEALVGTKVIKINRSGRTPMHTSQGWAVKVDQEQARIMEIYGEVEEEVNGEIVTTTGVIGNKVDQYLAANPDIPVQYLSAEEMRALMAAEQSEDIL